MKKILILFSFIFFSTLITAAEPKPVNTPQLIPKNFTLKEIPEVKAEFLMPDGWFYKQEVKGGTFAFFITKEDIAKDGEFYTGLSVNITPPLKENNSLDYAKAYAAGLMDQAKMLDIFRLQFGSFEGFGLQLQIFYKKKNYNIRSYHIVLANKKNNSVYIITFESPEKEWPKAWLTGQKILNNFKINDEF